MADVANEKNAGVNSSHLIGVEPMTVNLEG